MTTFSNRSAHARHHHLQHHASPSRRTTATAAAGFFPNLFRSATAASSSITTIGGLSLAVALAALSLLAPFGFWDTSSSLLQYYQQQQRFLFLQNATATSAAAREAGRVRSAHPQQQQTEEEAHRHTRPSSPQRNAAESNRHPEDGGFSTAAASLEEGGGVPEIIWLVSFPNSGTTYTIENVRHMMMTAAMESGSGGGGGNNPRPAYVATNYGTELTEKGDRLVSIFGTDFGPWYYPTTTSSDDDGDGEEGGKNATTESPEIPFPFVLVKTHCGGYCDSCDYGTSLVSFKNYKRLCLTTWGADSSEGGRSTYPPRAVERKMKKVVHLLRNPYDNLVARMHRGVRKRRIHWNWTSERLGVFEDTPEGFGRWCAQSDANFIRTMMAEGSGDDGAPRLPADVREMLLAERDGKGKLPCIADWIRYVRWHNHAYLTYSAMELEPLVVYYEDYLSKGSHGRLLNFLTSKAPTGSPDPLPFQADGKGYGYIYDSFPSETKVTAARLVRSLALPQVWALLRPYFAADVGASAVVQQQQQPWGGPISSAAGSAGRDGDEERKIVLLVSFPNSGTSYTLENVMHVTNQSVASQYGHEALQSSGRTVPVLEDRPNGPFWLRPHGTHFPKYVLTKTHCHGYCSVCKPLDSLISHDKFLEGCRMTTLGGGAGTLGETGSTMRSHADMDYPIEKIVHLIRNPLDNMVSRMHYANRWLDSVKNSNNTKGGSSSRDALLGYCAVIDEAFEKSGYTGQWLTFTPQAWEMFRMFPCFSDLLRYVQWHNAAIDVFERLSVPIHYMYYEDYTDRYDGSVNDLLRFLHFPHRIGGFDGGSNINNDRRHWQRQPYPFITGKTYRNYYNREEWQAAAHIIQLVASPKCWEYLRKYFSMMPSPSSDDEGVNDTGETEEAKEPTHLLNYNPKQREIVWLLSYPGSGAMSILQAMQHLTELTVATNFETSVSDSSKFLLPVRKTLVDGPYMVEPKLKCPRFVLTETDCSRAYSINDNDDAASAAQYSATRTLEQFELGCRTTIRMDEDRTVVSHYNTTVAKKIVHLIRSPMHALLDQMKGHVDGRHLSSNTATADLLNDPDVTTEKFLAWCSDVDAGFSKQVNVSSLFSDDEDGALLELFKRTPCSSVLFRYVQFHEHAVELSRKLPIPSHPLYYEDVFEPKPERTQGNSVENLLYFLEATARRPISDVIPTTETDPPHHRLYPRNQEQLAARLVRALASRVCWERLRRYFEDDNEWGLDELVTAQV